MIKVLIIDDSAVMRNVLRDSLSQYRDIEVVGTAANPFSGRDKIITLKPDVVTLDIEMPRMDGLTFLTKLMKYHPIPVVIISSVTPENSRQALDALHKGAVEVLCKEEFADNHDAMTGKIALAVRAASKVNILNSNTTKKFVPQNSVSVSSSDCDKSRTVIALGASTGGTQAIETILRQLPQDIPGMVIVQHMPSYFTQAFAERLNTIVAMEVREAHNNDIISPGTVLLAPGDYHMLLKRVGSRYHVIVKKGPLVHYQRPSVDVLFHSVAEVVGSHAIGVLCTGMGVDGANGMLEMKQQGAYTIAQNEDSCVVYGMPHEAIRLNAVDEIMSLETIANGIMKKACSDDM